MSSPLLRAAGCVFAAAEAHLLITEAGTAADIDPAAVRCAHRNLEGTGARVYEGDLYRALPVDAIVVIGSAQADVPRQF